MGKQTGRILFAVFLIGLGVIALLSNLNLLPFDINNNQTFWMAAFGIGGLAFVATFLSDIRANWWAAIPGFTLVGLGLLIGFDEFWGELGGGVFLGMIGLSFWAIFLTNRREHWWAVIPAGVMTSLVGVIFASSYSNNGMLVGGILFLGMALTFVLVYLFAHQQWALWPAGVLGILGVLIMTGAGGIMNLFWPAALILGGGWLIMRSMRTRVG